jgi:hypothetical protein
MTCTPGNAAMHELIRAHGFDVDKAALNSDALHFVLIL